MSCETEPFLKAFLAASLCTKASLFRTGEEEANGDGWPFVAPFILDEDLLDQFNVDELETGTQELAPPVTGRSEVRALEILALAEELSPTVKSGDRGVMSEDEYLPPDSPEKPGLVNTRTKIHPRELQGGKQKSKEYKEVNSENRKTSN